MSEQEFVDPFVSTVGVDAEFVDLNEIEELLDIADRKFVMESVGQETSLFHPEVKALSKTECQAIWSEAFESRPPEQKIIEDVLTQYGLTLWHRDTNAAAEIPEVDMLSNAERRRFFGRMRRSNLIATAYSWEEGKQVDWIRALNPWETVSPKPVERTKYGQMFGWN